ncbi:MAG TPA: ABC transporter ATP-binding protein [Alphaproteobacteria bacterium]
MTSIVKIQNVDVAYGKQQVLFGITCDIVAGECFGLIGLNGAGKTTLIKTLLGLRNPMSGSITMFDAAPGQDNVKHRMAYLPEKFEPPAFLTGLEFLRFALSLYKKKLSIAKANEWAVRFGLDPNALTRRVTTYSKGMRQKIGLMATMLTDVDLLILDEPMSGLDPRARAQVKDAIAAYQQQGKTVLICSHILGDLDELCAHIGVIHRGHLAFSGTPQGMKSQTGKDNLERAFLSVIDSFDVSTAAQAA